MNAKRFQEALATLTKFLILLKSKGNDTGMIWYHAMCLDFLLDATMTEVSYEYCCRFFNSNMDMFIKCEDDATSRFYANCMLWNMRHGCYEVATFWKEKLMRQFKVTRINSSVESYTGLRLLEMLTLEVAYFTMAKNDKKVKEVETKFRQVSYQVALGVENSNLFVERFKLHQLHLKMLKKFDGQKLLTLEQLERSALNKMDYFAVDIIKYTGFYWSGKLAPNIENFWKNHSTEETSLTVEQLSACYRVFPFSLPLHCNFFS